MNQKEKSYRPRFFRWGDFVVMAVVLLLAGISFFSLYIQAAPGSTAVITTPDGTLILPLDTESQRILTGNNGIEVVIRVSNGRIRFEQSGCPDHICVNTGWLSKNGQSAACLPAGIAVRVENGEGGLDYIV